jgi:hypothetical protein
MSLGKNLFKYFVEKILDSIGIILLIIGLFLSLVKFTTNSLQGWIGLGLTGVITLWLIPKGIRWLMKKWDAGSMNLDQLKVYNIVTSIFVVAVTLFIGHILTPFLGVQWLYPVLAIVCILVLFKKWKPYKALRKQADANMEKETKEEDGSDRTNQESEGTTEQASEDSSEETTETRDELHNKEHDGQSEEPTQTGQSTEPEDKEEDTKKEQGEVKNEPIRT